MTTKLLLRVAFLELPRNFLSPKRRRTDTPKGPSLVCEEGPDALQGHLGHFSMERIRMAAPAGSLALKLKH